MTILSFNCVGRSLGGEKNFRKFFKNRNFEVLRSVRLFDKKIRKILKFL